MNSVLANFKNRLLAGGFSLWATFWVLVVLVCLPAYKAGFVAEYINYLQEFEKASFLDFINRESAYVKSSYQLSTFFRYYYIYFFGKEPVAYFLLFSALHALVGWGIYRFFSRLFRDFSLPKAAEVAFVGSLLFLLNPNISEVTIWAACDHYYISICLQLLSFNLAIRYLHKPKNSLVIGNIIVFLLSVFCLEIFYVSPLLIFFLFCGYYWKGLISRPSFHKALLRFVLPMLLLFGLYLLGFRLFYGSWIAHYGTTDEFVLSFPDILKGYGRYMAYMGLMLGHWPWDWREPVYRVLAQPVFYILIPALLLLIPALSLLRFKKLSARKQLLVFVLGAFVCSITLCLTTFFDEFFSMYNSRRCYQAGIFFYMALALGLFALPKPKWGRLLFGLYFLLAVVLSVRISFRWGKAASIQFALLDNFSWYEAPRVFLLNLPSYYKDVRIMPDLKYNEFGDQLRFFTPHKLEGSLYSVLGYNMNEVGDGTHVSVLDSCTLKVTLNQWGSWWMYQYQGAADYENDIYKVQVKDVGHEYHIVFKQVPQKDDVVLFQRGEQWKRVDWNVRFPQEQW